MENPALEKKVNAISKAHRLSEPQPSNAIELLLNYIDFQDYKLNRLYGMLQDMQTLPVDKLQDTPRKIANKIREVNGW